MIPPTIHTMLPLVTRFCRSSAGEARRLAGIHTLDPRQFQVRWASVTHSTPPLFSIFHSTSVGISTTFN
jgi:hypothetical protein